MSEQSPPHIRNSSVPNSLIDSADAQLWIITHRSITSGHARKRTTVWAGDIGRDFQADGTDRLLKLLMINLADGVPL
jgi:hypothetical protein